MFLPCIIWLAIFSLQGICADEASPTPDISLDFGEVFPNTTLAFSLEHETTFITPNSPLQLEITPTRRPPDPYITTGGMEDRYRFEALRYHAPYMQRGYLESFMREIIHELWGFVRRFSISQGTYAADSFLVRASPIALPGEPSIPRCLSTSTLTPSDCQ